MTTTSLARAFLDSASRHESRPALWARDKVLTYRDLREQAREIADALVRSGGVARGDRVAVLADRTEIAYLGILAALLADAAFVPLNPRYPLERNAGILKNSGAVALVVDGRNASMVDRLPQDDRDRLTVIAPDAPLFDRRRRVVKSDAPAGIARPGMRTENSDDDLAYIFYTSGSTGAPKGVPISHGNVLSYLDGISALCTFNPDDRFIQLVDLTFDLSIHDMFACWLNGAMLVSVPEVASLLMTRFVAEHGITSCMAVPSVASLAMQAGLLSPGLMPSLRSTFFCGEALTTAVAETWSAAAPNAAVFNLYGPTEATVAISAFRYRPGGLRSHVVVPLGHAFANQEMALFGSDGARSPPGSTAEICLSGPQVTAGYWNAPAMTAQQFFTAASRRWYRTGDLARYEAGLGYVFAGRADRQVKIRGFRVELQEIENALRRATARDAVAVVPLPGSEGGIVKGVAAFVVGEEIDAAELSARLADILPAYMIPAEVHFRVSMPFNANGKVDYDALSATLNETRRLPQQGSGV